MKYTLASIIVALGTPSLAEGSSTFDDLRKELERLGQDSQSFMQEFFMGLAPLMEDLGDQIGNLNLYEAPEILPNGDIIIRRKKEQQSPPIADGEIDI